MLQALTGCDIRAAESVMHAIDNLSTKLSIVFEIAERKPSDAKAAALLRVKSDVLAAVAFRNKLAHGLFGIDRFLDVSLINNMLHDRRGKPSWQYLGPNQMRKTTERLRKAMVVMENEVAPPLNYERLEVQARASQNMRAQARAAQGKPRRA